MSITAIKTKLKKIKGEVKDCYFESGESRKIEFENGKLKKINTYLNQGGSLRVIEKGAVKISAYSNLKNLYKKISVPYKPLIPEKGFPDFNTDKLKKISKTVINRVYSKLKNVKNLTVNAYEAFNNIRIVTPEKSVFEKRIYFKFDLSATIIYNSKPYSFFDKIAASLPFETIKKSEFTSLADSVIKTLNIIKNARRSVKGDYTVVIGPGFGGAVFHEACGHSLEADHYIKGLSVYNGMLGKKIAAPCVNYVDNPIMPGKFGSFKFDDEGNKAKKNILIKNGALKNLMQSKQWNVKKGVICSGRRENYEANALVRMSNTYIDNGEFSPEEIISSVKKGVYVKSVTGGQVDPLTGRFIFSVPETYMIEKGKITFPLKDTSIMGSGQAALKNVEMVGNDLKLVGGYCGKGQTVPVCVGQPTIKIKNLTVI